MYGKNLQDAHKERFTEVNSGVRALLGRRPDGAVPTHQPCDSSKHQPVINADACKAELSTEELRVRCDSLMTLKPILRLSMFLSYFADLFTHVFCLLTGTAQKVLFCFQPQ